MLDLTEPRIVASVTSDLMDAVDRAVDADADIIELRMDLYRGDALDDLEGISGELPVIATNRAQRQGGEYTGDEAKRVESLLEALESEAVECIDIELDTDRKQVESVVERAHGMDKSVIVSHHDFDETPGKQGILDTMKRCRELGGIPKVAVMPESPGDTLELLEATIEYSGDCCTISMGAIGRYTRVMAPVFGSKLTYGSLGEPVAPGQLSTAELKQLLMLFGGI